MSSNWGARLFLCVDGPLQPVLGPQMVVTNVSPGVRETFAGDFLESGLDFYVAHGSQPPYKVPAFLIPSPTHEVYVGLLTYRDDDSFGIAEFVEAVLHLMASPQVSAGHLETDDQHLAMYWLDGECVVNSFDSGGYAAKRQVVTFELMSALEEAAVDYRLEDHGDMLDWPFYTERNSLEGYQVAE